MTATAEYNQQEIMSNEFNPKATSNCMCYIAHEVNGKVYNNRSVVIFAPSATGALWRAKEIHRLIAPVISAVQSSRPGIPTALDAETQRIEERNMFNRNYKPQASGAEVYDDWA